jgi:hypothetical protein
MRRTVFSLVGVLLAAATPAAAEMTSRQHDSFMNSCTTQLFESEATCECMARVAGDTLSDDAILYLSISATDVVRSAALAKSMSQAEVASIDRFMQTVPKQCRTGG